MVEQLAPIIVSVLVWWISTGALIWLVGRGRTTRYIAATLLTVSMLAAMAAIVQLRADTSWAGAYLGFALGILIWAWHEAMLLFGLISGPTRSACPEGVSGWKRFEKSALTIIYHELGIAVHAIVIFWLSVGAANQVAAATFALLWGMRISAKLLIFLGAQNASTAFLPAHLKYLGTYFNTTRNTPFFPIFLGLTSVVGLVLMYQGLSAPAGTFEGTVFLLLGTLAVLAAFEHVALIFPIQDQQLWSWAIRENVGAEKQEQNDKLEYGRT